MRRGGYYRTLKKKTSEVEEGDPIANRSPALYLTPASIDPDVTTDGATISGNAWEDVSGNGLHATVGGGTMKLNIGSTGRQVEFDGASWLDFPNDSSLMFNPTTDPFTIILRLGDVISTADSFLACKSDSATADRMFSIHVRTSGFYQVNAGGVTSDILPTTMNANSLVIAVVKPTGVNVWIDGVQVVTNGSVGSTTAPTWSWNLGSRRDGLARVSAGTNLDLFAIIPSALTTPQRLAIEAEYQIN